MTEAHLQNPSLTHDQYYILFDHDILVNIWRFRLENAIHDMVSPITNLANYKLFLEKARDQHFHPIFFLCL